MKDDKFRYLVPSLRKLGAAYIRSLADGSLESRCTTFPFAIIELFLLALIVEALQGKTCQDLLLSGGGRSLGAKISGGRGCLCGIFFWFLQN